MYKTSYQFYNDVRYCSVYWIPECTLWFIMYILRIVGLFNYFLFSIYFIHSIPTDICTPKKNVFQKRTCKLLFIITVQKYNIKITKKLHSINLNNNKKNWTKKQRVAKRWKSFKIHILYNIFRKNRFFKQMCVIVWVQRNRMDCNYLWTWKVCTLHKKYYYNNIVIS